MRRGTKVRPLYLCKTRRGDLVHLTRRGTGVTLCGRLVHDITRNWQNGKPVAWSEHWQNDAVTGGNEMCGHCDNRALPEVT